MNMRNKLIASALLLTTIVAFAQRGAASQAPQALPRDKQIESYRLELLDTAFSTASTFPVVPHIKNQARAQQEVILACLEMELPNLALKYTQQVKNWRQGVGYGGLAFYLARHNQPQRARHYLMLAERHASTIGLKETRKAKIESWIARTHAALGEQKKADEIEENLGAEAEEVIETNAAFADEAQFDEHIKRLDALVALGEYDGIRYALYGYGQLFDKFYSDKKRRELAEKKMRVTWQTVPLFVRIDVLARMTEVALRKDDLVKAMHVVDELHEVVTGAAWRKHDQIRLLAEVAALRYRAGDAEKARKELDSTTKLFDEYQDDIKDYLRPEALRPLAEAYATLGDDASAFGMYRKTVEQGAVNPNRRPRTTALVSTCVSMALHEIEPDDALWSRIREIHKGLAEQ